MNDDLSYCTVVIELVELDVHSASNVLFDMEISIVLRMLSILDGMMHLRLSSSEEV